MKIVILDGQTLTSRDDSWAALHRAGEVVYYARSAEADVVPRARGAQVLITNKAMISRTAIEQLPELRFIAVSATGYNCVDVQAARAHDIPVANVPEYGTDSVAQFVFALLLHVCHHIALHDAAVKCGEWERQSEWCFWKTPLVELAGKTMGIIGFGRIGRKVGELAHAFGMEVVACNPSMRPAPAYEPFSWANPTELTRRADVVSLHCPLNEQTAGMVNNGFLRAMKPTAYLINTARGGLVNETDLADALHTGRIAAAAVDVVSREPIQADNPLLTAKNCFITPHIAWATEAARKRLLDKTVENVLNYLAGNPSSIVSM